MNDLCSILKNLSFGFCESSIIGPFFIDGNLNAATYMNLLQNEVILLLKV